MRLRAWCSALAAAVFLRRPRRGVIEGIYRSENRPERASACVTPIAVRRVAVRYGAGCCIPPSAVLRFGPVIRGSSMPPGGSLRLIVRRGRPEPERGAGSETKRVRFPTQMSECYPLPGLSRAPRPARSPTLTRLLTLTISLLEFSTQQNNSRLPQTSLLLCIHTAHTSRHL